MTAIGALDIGGTKIAATVASEAGPLARITRPTPKIGTPRTLPEQCVAMLDEACSQAGIRRADLSAVGVSSCGPFAKRDGLLGLATPNICGARSGSADLPNDWDFIPLADVLSEHFEHFVIENDCVSALIAERLFGSARDEPDCVYVTWSTGIGFGFCVDGHVLRGKHGNAGHAGHMLMSELSEAVCGCGNRGDLEALVSGRNLGNRIGHSAAEVFNAARAGDAGARAVVMEAARWFGRGLFNVAVTLDTRLFVLGGSVWEHHGDWLASAVMQEIETRLPALTRSVRVVDAGLGALVADVGALSLVMPASWIEGWRDRKPWISPPSPAPASCG